MYIQGMNDIVKTMEAKKEKITEELSRQYSLGQISLEEYERLIEYAHNLETERELITIEKIIHENTVTRAARIKNDYTILSSRKMPGSMLRETNGKIITILGDNHILINEEDLAGDENFIDAVVVLGELVIHAPKNITVINKAVPILGGIFGNEEGGNGSRGKKLTIRGKVILGNVTIKQET
jgi:hypothetical protein